MAYQKLQVGLGIKVVPSDTINIPNASGALFAGTVASVSTNTITVTQAPGVSFLDMNLAAGMIVQNDAATNITTIVSVDDADSITLGNVTGFSGTTKFKIFTQDSVGCVLYVGNASADADTFNVSVVTSSGSELTFSGLQSGSFIPVQVKQVKATGTGANGTGTLELVALW